MHIDLSGNVALVTGAGTGIGEGIATALAASGATVIVNDVDESAAAATAAAIGDAGGDADVEAADVADAAAVQAMVERVGARHGRLDTLVNNAGIAYFAGIRDTDPADFDRLVDVDLRAVYLMTRACVPLLEASPSASVVNISSVHALATVPFMTAYAAAKAGVVGMVRSLAQDLGPAGIRVNVVSPGFVATPLYESWLETEPDPEAAAARVEGLLPLGRIASTADVANLVVFLASDAAACITGANHVIDSGLTTRLMH